MPTELHVLRVFVAPDGSAGNPLGVFLDGPAIPEQRRLSVAAELGFSETVFVDDRATGTARIFTPGTELAFAGHPTVGCAWLLAETGWPVDALHIPAGEVPTWTADGRRWVRARASWIHPITFDELSDAAAVEALTGPPPDEDSYYAWAWLDRAGGVIRSRYLAAGIGIAEDEATGAAAIVLTDRLGQDLEIHQGRGSRISTRLGPDGTIDLGGRAVLDEIRSFG
ncbi:MAG: PhzF family phenazine biosynthesis protein [Chloroflexota bacterium]|nr:PhzF family phenazine biosynthesis protein [Chloroflexota bacterium]